MKSLILHLSARAMRMVAFLAWPPGVAGVILALALGLGAISVWPMVVGRAYQTELGEQHFVRLADRSRVQLDTDSRIRVKLSSGKRAIELVYGRAFFNVAHDPTGPSSSPLVRTRYEP